MMVYSEIKRYRRYKGWDYAKGSSLFITIATAPRRALFGKVRGDAVALSPLGEKVKEALEAIPRLNPGILLFGHVVMPDHVHFNCALLPGLAAPLKVLGNAIRRFKNYTTKLANGHLWQQGYHDYILLSREMIDATERYIAYNPMKWELMYGVEGALRVIEPLFMPRLNPGDYWKGVGNPALLPFRGKDEHLAQGRKGVRQSANILALNTENRMLRNSACHIHAPFIYPDMSSGGLLRRHPAGICILTPMPSIALAGTHIARKTPAGTVSVLRRLCLLALYPVRIYCVC